MIRPFLMALGSPPSKPSPIKGEGFSSRAAFLLLEGGGQVGVMPGEAR
jgi:hypothetical protein